MTANAFTAAPTLQWGDGKPHTRPDLAPRKSGITVQGRDPASGARRALTDSQMDVLERWRRRVNKG